MHLYRGYASYIGIYYIVRGAGYSASYGRVYNVDQLVTYGGHKGCEVYVAEVKGYIYTIGEQQGSIDI